MQMELLSGFKTMMHNTFCTLINNKGIVSFPALFGPLGPEFFGTCQTRTRQKSFNFLKKIDFLLFKIFKNIWIYCKDMSDSGPNHSP